jgi:type II secretory pathway pseudopilin PulG
MRSERGFSLIEVLTATGITVLLLGIALRSFSDALKVDDAMKLMTEVDQNLQSATTYMERDLVDTGRNWPTGGIPLPSGTGSVPVVRPGTAADAAAGWPSATTLLPVIPGDNLGTTVGSQQTDTITVCFMDGILGTMNVTSFTQTGTTATMVLAPTVTMNTRPENTIAVGDLIYVVNGLNKVVQRVTAVNAATRTLTFDQTADDMKINQPGAASGNNSALLGKPDNVAQRVMMVTYYVAMQGGVPYLWRQLNNTPAVAVAIGITNLQIAYDAVTGTTTGSTVVTNNIYADGYTAGQIDQAILSISAKSDRPLRMSTRYITNDIATQIGFRSLSAKQDYTLGP